MESTTLNQSIKPVFQLLKYTFGIVPIVAGLDKFTNLLTNWGQYVSPGMGEMLPMPVSNFMMIIGIVEILAGIIVLIKTEIGGYIVAAWLTLIAISLFLSLNFVDVAVRDLVMAVSAFSMAKIATHFA